ncbi:DUF1989 domain-containing protein [Microvirga aerophila]|nr:DUF1989 domain-containing protein [Microvirga aerophila]
MTETNLETLPARSGRAARLKAGQAIKVINTHGQAGGGFLGLQCGGHA